MIKWLDGCGRCFAKKRVIYLWNQLTRWKVAYSRSLPSERKGVSHSFEITHHKYSGESADNDVRLFRGERACSRKTEVSGFLFLWCRLVTFWGHMWWALQHPVCFLTLRVQELLALCWPWRQFKQQTKVILMCRISPFLRMRSIISFFCLYTHLQSYVKYGSVKMSKKPQRPMGNAVQPDWNSFMTWCNQPLLFCSCSTKTSLETGIMSWCFNCQRLVCQKMSSRGWLDHPEFAH